MSMDEVHDIDRLLREIEPHRTRFTKILADMDRLKTTLPEEISKNERIRNISDACVAFLAKRKEVRRLQDEGVSWEHSPSFDGYLVELIKLRSEYEHARTFLSDEEKEFLGNFVCLGLYFGASIADCLDQLEFFNPALISDMESMLRFAATLDPLAPLLADSMKEMSALGKTLPPDELEKLYSENQELRAKNEKEEEIVIGKLMKNIERMTRNGVRSLVLKNPPIQTLMTLEIILRMAQFAMLFEEGKNKS